MNDPGPDDEAFARVIDRLLASPHFGERWGRHWLDVARYADTTGGGRSIALQGTPGAIATTSSTPSTRTSRSIASSVEQIAGDLLPATTARRASEQLTATGVSRARADELRGAGQAAAARWTSSTSRSTRIGRAFLGMTIGCARCHDHKFDPIPTRDYYAMAGIFRSTQTLIHDNVSTWVKRPVPLPPEQQSIIDAHAQELAAVQKQIAAHGAGTEKAAIKQVRGGRDKPHIVEDPMSLPGVVVDEAAAEVTGDWTSFGLSASRMSAPGTSTTPGCRRGEKKVIFGRTCRNRACTTCAVAYNFASRGRPTPPSALFIATVRRWSA